MTRPLRVLHVGPYPNYGRGSGVDAATWPLLAAQVTAGLDVWLLALRELTPTAHTEAARVGVSLATSRLRHFQMLSPEGAAAVERIRPDVVHFHSVFIPGHSQLDSVLNRMSIPYVISPHGGMKFWRDQLKKIVYTAIVEKRHFLGARTIVVLTNRERDLVESWLGEQRKGWQGKAPGYAILPNPVQPLSADTVPWRMPHQPRLVYLGRYDVRQKGLDRLVEVARRLPGVQVSAHGSANGVEVGPFQDLCRGGLPGNIRFHEPVYNQEKTATLASATIYVQMSRAEGFGMSIVEAMRQGVPAALTRDCDLADTIAQHDLGLVLPKDVARAATDLAGALADPDRLRRWSRAGQEWTVQMLSPKQLAYQSIAIYEAAIASARGGWTERS